MDWTWMYYKCMKIKQKTENAKYNIKFKYFYQPILCNADKTCLITTG